MKLYPETKVLIIVLFLFFASLFILKYTKANFSDSEKLLGNSIEVGVWDMTPSPSGPINTPTPTPTPTEIPPEEPTITLSPTPTNTSTVTPTPINLANHIVISEILPIASSPNFEFVELYNPTGSEVNISDWSIQYMGGGATTYNKKGFETNDKIPAYGFFLTAFSGYTNPALLDMHTSISLTDTGGTVFLVNDHNDLTSLSDNGPTVVDKVAYGTGTNLRPKGSAFIPAPGSNQSIERKAYSTSDTTLMMTGSDVIKGNAYDSNNNANDFVLRTISQPQNSSSPIEIP